MPITSSARKRMRSSEKKRLRNQSVLSEIRTLKKQYRLLIAQDPKQAETLERRLISTLDKASRKGVIPRGRADRLKARAARARTRRSSQASK